MYHGEVRHQILLPAVIVQSGVALAERVHGSCVRVRIYVYEHIHVLWQPV